MSPVYDGLAALPKLRSLHVRFPSNRSPLPTNLLPAIPGLRSLTLTHIDPLCYPDDPSLLLYEARHLEELRMHWSPRMRQEGEPSVHLSHYFRKNIAAKRKLKLKTLGVYNLFALNNPEMEDATDEAVLEHLTVLNSFGLDEEGGLIETASSNGLFAFLDAGWDRPPDGLVRIRSVRHDRISRVWAYWIAKLKQLEAVYIVNVPRRDSVLRNDSNGMIETPLSATSDETSGSHSENTPRALSGPSSVHALRDLYLDTFSTYHGANLKHLMLPDRWCIPSQQMARLLRNCPNITQLALALDFESFESLRMLLPFLKELWAFRLLVPSTGREARERLFQKIVEQDDETHRDKMSQELAKDEYASLRMVGMGWKVFEIGGRTRAEIEDLTQGGRRAC